MVSAVIIGISSKITQTGPNGGRLRAEKGINFPDTNLEIPALTEKDQVDLHHIVDHVDMVALSFLRAPQDVELLVDHL